MTATQRTHWPFIGLAVLLAATGCRKGGSEDDGTTDPVEDEVVRKANGMKFDENLESSEKLRKWLEGLGPEDFGKYKM